MGADGGVAWVKVSDLPRFRELIAPWAGYFQDDGFSAVEQSRVDWERANPAGPDEYRAFYGTDLGDVQLSSLPEFLDALAERLNQDLLWSKATFSDMLDDWYSDPDPEHWGWFRHTPDYMSGWIRALKWASTEFKHMVVSAWVAEIRRIWPDQRVYCVETWT